MQNLSPLDYLSNPSRFHLVDVRSDEEWEAAHDQNAAHVPLIELMDKASSLPRDKPLLLICRTGGRSARACEMLQDSGLEIYNLAGGMRALVIAKKEKGLVSEKEFERLMARL
ncbi:MAG: rhodanese-like domain-containing protein [Candidatus Marsarchaeota archaeon]|nr:rhodanese-like domain-containing protein [Candidatus Marsarchaeota archaeon]